jgi:hypothetical protein
MNHWLDYWKCKKLTLLDIFANKIGLALIKEPTDSSQNANLLIKRYTLEIDDLASNSSSQEANKFIENNEEMLLDSDDEWNFRDSILKCLYSKDVSYPFSEILLENNVK